MKKRINKQNETITITMDRFDAEMVRAAIQYLQKYGNMDVHLTTTEKDTLLLLHDKLEWQKK